MTKKWRWFLGLLGGMCLVLVFVTGCATTPEVEKNNMDVVQRVFHEAWNQKKLDVIDEIQIVEKQMKETRPDFSYRFSLSPFSEYDRRQMAEVKGGASP